MLGPTISAWGRGPRHGAGGRCPDTVGDISWCILVVFSDKQRVQVCIFPTPATLKTPLASCTMFLCFVPRRGPCSREKCHANQRPLATWWRRKAVGNACALSLLRKRFTKLFAVNMSARMIRRTSAAPQLVKVSPNGALKIANDF